MQNIANIGNAEPKNSTIEISKLRLDGGTQPRAELNLFTVEEYKDSFLNGAQMPPVTVFYDGSEYWLADGFHRVTAAAKAEIEAINADIKQGTKRDAVLYSVGANSSHGLRRTNEDKRRAVITLLEDSEWQKWSDNEIAKQCSVDNKTVGKYRKEVTSDFLSERTYTTKYGTTATMQTHLIGKYSLTDKWLKILNEYPTKYHNTIWDTAVNEAKSKEKDITEGMLRRIAASFTEVATTGYTDIGNGKSTPISAALSLEDTEADKRNKQYINDGGKKKKELINEAVKNALPITHDFEPDVINDDCLKYLPLIDDEVADLICVDPPYNIDKAEWDSYGNGKEYAKWCEQWLKECYRILKPTGSIYIFGVNRMLSHLQHEMDSLGFIYRNWITWDTVQGAGGGLWVNRQENILYYSKTKETYEDADSVKLERHETNVREYKGKEYLFKNPSNIWRFPCVDNQHPERVPHPTQKPTELIERIIKANCPENGLVIDPFAGSGTTLIASMKNNRRSLGIELEKEYLDYIQYRIRQVA